MLIEIWQADANGIYPSQADTREQKADPAFQGWGRTGADFETGVWSFNTIKPARQQAVKVQLKHLILH